jgi:hypothetical protein
MTSSRIRHANVEPAKNSKNYCGDALCSMMNCINASVLPDPPFEEKFEDKETIPFIYKRTRSLL